MKIIRITAVTDIVTIILLQSVTLPQKLSISAVSNYSDCNLSISLLLWNVHML